MVKNSRRGRPKYLKVAPRIVRLLFWNPPPLSSRALTREVNRHTEHKVSRGTVEKALRFLAKILPEDWAVFGVEAPNHMVQDWPLRGPKPGHSGKIAHGNAVVRYDSVMAGWYNYSHEEDVRRASQILAQARRPRSDSTLGEAIVSSTMIYSHARLRVHDIGDLRAKFPEWDSMTRLEKVEATRQVDPIHEQVSEPTVARHLMDFVSGSG